jgi:phospholipid/cholesterol/gamma-HCH transport system substrate-binding protein
MSRVARLGAFIVVTLAVFAAGVFIIGSKEYLFHSTYQLKAQFENVAGLAEGADVQVGGVHSGTVTGILLPTRPGEKVTVVMELARSTHEIIKQGSVASIETQGLLGNQYMAISFGSSGQSDVRDGQIIQSEPPLEMADLLRKTNGILDTSQQAIRNVTQATAHLNSVSAKIDSGQGTVGALVNDKQLYSNLANTTTTLDATMVQAQTGVTDFKDNMEALKHSFLLSGYFKKRGYENVGNLSANAVGELPHVTPSKEFAYTVKQLFDRRDSAKLKHQKTLNSTGEFLEDHEFGFAVIVVSSGMEGDTQKNLILTQARAVVVRDYLIENFGFDDSHLKTLGMGKQLGANLDADWGSIQILIFPAGTEIPVEKLAPGGTSSTPGAEPVGQVADAATRKP